MTLKKKYRAVSLISGGLDSLLATRLVLDQNIAVEGLNFFTGFCVEGHTHAIRKRNGKKRNHALWVAEKLGIRLHIVDVIEEYKNVLLNPKHGYGKNLNPCLDCKSFMVRKAMAWMHEHDFDFIITGEVVGQRPMSQRKDTMPLVQKESGAGDLLLRPLCAKHLPPTKPEREGWVKREKLLDFCGRGRFRQMALAEHYGFEDYATPAGGCCFLTDKKYADKLSDMWRARGKREYQLDDLMMLKVGRHIRPNPRFKMIISREEGEGKFLAGYKNQYTHLQPISCKGALALVDGTPNAEDLVLAARILARYSHDKNKNLVEVEAVSPGEKTQSFAVRPMDDAKLKAWFV